MNQATNFQTASFSPPPPSAGIITQQSQEMHLPESSDPGHFDPMICFNNVASTTTPSSADSLGEAAGIANFLRDVMAPDVITHENDWSTSTVDPILWDVLDFTVDNYDHLFDDNFSSQRTSGLRTEVPTLVTQSGCATPTGRHPMIPTEQAWNASLWCFAPASHDHVGAEQATLLIPLNNLAEKTRVLKPLCPPLTQMARDRVLARVLSTCEPTVFDKVPSSFPSTELLTNLVHRWLEFHHAQASNWFHLPSFDPEGEIPEIILNMAAAGATLSHLPQVRKLGLALLEAARIANAALFEKDNRNIRKLRPLQCSVIQLEAALWSGGRRMMEIAESFAQPLITMLRRGGRFQQSPYNLSLGVIDDDPGECENKWRGWIEQESFKRLVFATFERDVQSSMSLLSPPLISCTELCLPLPLPLDFWRAHTAEEWRQACISRSPLCKEIPTFKRYIESSPAILNLNIVDLDLSLLIWLYGHWTCDWHYRQWSSVAKLSLATYEKDTTFILSSLQQENTKLLERFKMETLELTRMSPTTTLTYQRLLMNNYSPLDDFQLLAGKNGQEEAKRVYSSLATWAQSREARQAICHAALLLQAAKELPFGMLQHANAIACYHAGLVLWAFALISKGVSGDVPTTSRDGMHDYALLDHPDDPKVQRFIVLGKGTPTICPYNENGAPVKPISVFETRAVMRLIGHLLCAKNPCRDGESSLLIDNLSKLLRALGRAVPVA